MDPLIQGSMIFAIIMTVILGGFIVTFPVMRRLGRVMEESLRDRQRARLGDGDRARLEGEITELQRTVGNLEAHVDLLGERQDFMENLISHRDPERLPDGENWKGGGS
jgi:hypothetical protein